MFRKPFKVKCQTQMKTNEKKKIVSDVTNYFPAIDVNALITYLGDKEDITKMRILTYNKEVIDVWLFARIPMFFYMKELNVTLPTIYMCWAFPQIIPQVTTNDYVMGKLKTGADLFSPGVYFETKEMMHCILDVDDPISVNTVANAAPTAVGICTMELACGLQSGRFARIVHTADDYLCRYHPLPHPSWGPVEMVSEEEAEGSAQGNAAASEPDPPERPSTSRVVRRAPPPASTDMLEDNMIMHCFLKALKAVPLSIFPILPAHFFANFMLSNAPAGARLNMRKSKWKKLHVFLKDMSKTNIIKIETMRPNEYRILSFDQNHELLTSFHDPYEAAAASKPVTLRRPVALRANIPPIVFDVGMRASNKKVTIISNLHEYAIDIPRFAKLLQQAAAASCLVIEPDRSNGKRSLQVQVQGNQILVAAKLINDVFGIGTIHMRGLEKAPKVRR